MTSIFDKLEREAESAGHGIAAAAGHAEHVITAHLPHHGYHEPSSTTEGATPMSVETRLDALKADVEDVFAKYAPDVAKDAQTAAAVASSPPAQSMLQAVHLQEFPDVMSDLAAWITKVDAVVAQAQEAQAKAESALAAAQAPAEPAAGDSDAAPAPGSPADAQPQTFVAS